MRFTFHHKQLCRKGRHELLDAALVSLKKDLNVIDRNVYIESSQRSKTITSRVECGSSTSSHHDRTMTGSISGDGIMMRVQARYATIAVLSLVFVMLSCKDENSGEEGSPSNVVFPVDSVSYDVHVQPLFNQACAFAGCHDANPQNSSPLRLDSWFNTVAAIPGNVVPRNPDGSVLVLRIQGSVGQRMPINTNPLNQNQINGIRTWIAEGARQN